jgi:hypothetical protein
MSETNVTGDEVTTSYVWQSGQHQPSGASYSWDFTGTATTPASVSTYYYAEDPPPAAGAPASTIWISTTDPPGALQLIENFQIVDPSDVMNFLRGQPTLIPLLNQSLIALRSTFGESARLGLELSRTPGTVDTGLYCFVQTSLGPDDAIEALRRFDQFWWIDRVSLADGKLNFDVSLTDDHV